MNDAGPRLSLAVVIPAYNEEASIADCLDSLLNQTEPFEEIIIVDNNSTDGTAQLVKEYQHNRPELIRLLHEPKQRPVFARNTGFDAARSDIIARLDVDTRLEKDWAACVRQIFADSDVMAVSGNSTFYDTPRFSRRVASRVHWFIAHRINEFLVGGKMLMGSNTALRRQTWQTVRNHLCERRDIFEDLDLAIHCKQLGLHVAYEDAIQNWVSPRRYLSTLRSIVGYLRKWPRTFHAHGDNLAAVLLLTIIPVLLACTYLPCYLLRAYEPLTERWSLRRFLQFEPYDS